MAYTNTTLLGLNLPTTGSEPGVWGDDINLGTTTLIEISIAGTNNITYDGDVTLSVSNGSSGSSFTSTVTTSTSTGIAQYYILNLSGSRAAPRTITAPTSSRVFLVTNATTVAYTIKKSGGTGITVAASETCVVYYNTVTADYAKGPSNITSIVTPALGGTGVANGTNNTITFTGNYTLGLTLTGNTAVTFPTSGTLVNTAVTTLSSLVSVGTITTGTWNASSISTTYTAAKVTDVQAGTGVTLSGTTGSVTVNIGQAVGTASSVQFGSFGVGTAASGTTGEIRATNNVTAYYSSDIKFKENVQDIPDALGIVTAIGSKTFDWTDEYLAEHGGEDEYFQPKQSFGVIAQDVQKVFPQAVRTREDGSLAVDYEKLAILSFGAIGQLLKRVEALESK